MVEHSPLVSTIVVGLVLAFGFGAIAQLQDRKTQQHVAQTPEIGIKAD